MKKLMIAFAVVAVAAASQAASFKWTSSGKGYGIADVDAVVDNGSYAAGTSSPLMKGNGTWNYALTIYTAGTSTIVDTFTGTLSTPGSGKILFQTDDSTKVAAATAYDYVLKITGTQDALNDRGKESSGYDYTNAALAYEYAKGTITTETMGQTTLTGMAAPASWTVSGITYEKPGPEPTPEPTSAMLMLLGVAGLALRRKQK